MCFDDFSRVPFTMSPCLRVKIDNQRITDHESLDAVSFMAATDAALE